MSRATGPRGKRARGERGLYDPTIQLEQLPEREEGKYQRLVAWIARSLPWGLGLFAIVTLVESQSGILADLAGRAWMNRLGRLPSSNSGQGNLGLNSMLGMLHARTRSGPVKTLFAGDSVLSPNLGGGAASEIAMQDLVSNLIPDSVNLSQEGGEWAFFSLWIQKLSQDPEIQRQKPMLVTDLDFKHFGTRGSWTPAFPAEIALCQERPDPSDTDVDALCGDLAKEWPKTLARVAGVSPSLYAGLQGQLDFFMTFIQRAPVYVSSFNQRGLGFHPFRTFRSGIADGEAFSQAYRERAPDVWTLHYGSGDSSMTYFMSHVTRGYLDPTHPKHVWLKSLARTLSRWPGPVRVVWIRPSPNTEAALTPEQLAVLTRMEVETAALMSWSGKADLKVVSNREIAANADDYVDNDHFTPKGHRKLADYIRSQTP